MYLIPALTGRHQVLLAGFQPPYRATEVAREIGYEQRFAVDRSLHPETAALIARRNDPDFRLRQLEDFRQAQPLQVWTLGRHPRRYPFGRVPNSKRSPRFKRGNSAAMCPKTLPHNKRRFRDPTLRFFYVGRMFIG
jgi:hypothetical protein